ncbi:MAG: glutaredoxin domain-containing protein [Candidatus Diapherotrites archaeon]|nr:glutaredoxin domain-containing protein [Candidatus Diapherotrites archaeon]
MHNVTIYTTTMCHWCHKAKEYFKANNIEYKEFNVQEDTSRAQEMVEKSGQTGVPVIDIDGQVIIGFNRPAIEAALK